MEQSEILERAKALGKQLADNMRVKAYLAAQQGLQRDEQARKLLRDYQLLAEKLQHQQAEGKRIADQDAEQLGRFEQQLAMNDTVKAWLKAQSDYVDLMYRVDRSIQEGLAEAIGGPAARQQGAHSQHGPASQPFTPRIVTPPSGEAEA
jgi:cell fate (sporulation/competence/biofilm development) regulator YlbF (YheA/YmcA/DUF963 family)